MSFKYVQLENGQSCHETEMASTSEKSTVYTGHLEETTRHLSMLGSVTRQSFSLIAIWSNQNQFYERRKNDSESNRCRSVIKQQPQPSDCYRQINAISNKRYQSTISQRSRSSFFDMTVSYLFDSWHQCHHSFHIHPLIFILFFVILLHCSQAISRADSLSLSSSVSSSSPFSSRSFSIGLEFDPRVSAKCERNLMHISVVSEQPFNGILHVRNFRRNPCQTYGNGSLLTTLTIDLLAQTNRPIYCGVHRAKGSEERSISLVVRLHRSLELSDDKHFVITCGNTEFYNKNKNEKLLFKFVDVAGHKISKLYHGESYRLRAEIVTSQELASASTEGASTISTTSSYHLYVRNCFIFAGNDSDVEFLDANGCPTLSSVGAFKQIGHNIAEAEIASMFKLPGTNQLHLQCMVELVDNCPFCETTLCPALAAGNDNRKAKMQLVPALQPADMQMLASTTAYVFEPDQQMTASIQAANGNCSEWQFPWLIALSIMLGVLLVLMLTVNIFLCTSMSCSCFKQEIDREHPIEDYDPYKIDVGFFSPYESGHSLNRNYHPVGLAGSFISGNDSGEHFFSGSHQRQHSPGTSSTQHQIYHPTGNHMLLSSYSPLGDHSASQQTTTNRPIVAAVRQANNSAPNRAQGSTANKPPRNRQQIPNGASQPLDRHSPRSIRSQEFY